MSNNNNYYLFVDKLTSKCRFYKLVNSISSIEQTEGLGVRMLPESQVFGVTKS
jgi:hypothetical protein